MTRALRIPFLFTLALPFAAAQPQGAGAPAAANDLFITVGKSAIVTSTQPIERVSVGYGDVADAKPVSPNEVLVNGRAPGETSLIVWQQGGGKLFFDVTVRANPARNEERIESALREMRKELPNDDVTMTIENDTVFVRGIVGDLVAAERAMSIAGSLGKAVNLLQVQVPGVEDQILLRVQFASVDRNVSSELGLNLVSTGATNTIGSVTTQQFAPPNVRIDPQAGSLVTLSDALNIFLFRPDLNLGATIKALQRRGFFEILAEPNVLAINGKQASFLAGGEFPYPILQGGGLGLGQVTIAFREFGVRINFIPVITPRGTIKLDVAPEVSALDFGNGLLFQGFTIPALTVRRVHTQVELDSGQSFAIGGLLDRRLTETLQKIPLLGDIPGLGKLFQSRSLNRQNNELLVIVTPERVRPIPEGAPRPMIEFPRELTGNTTLPRTPGIQATGPVAVDPVRKTMPIETYQQYQKAAETKLDTSSKGSGVANTGFQPPPLITPSTSPAAPSPTAPK